ncbi:MAG: class I SAM-dependent methyltransferase [Candidatus Acidiferrales bacterium]
MTTDQKQLDRVRERFTRTAQQFASFSLAKRSAEAEKLVALAAPRGDERALDLACGPGTFTRAFAPRVRRISGLDLTPALMAYAHAAAAQAGLANTAFACGTAAALPFADGSLDLVTCGYSMHHFGEPAAALREVTRVLRAGGRLALMDMIVPGEVSRVAGEANNGIERVRDASHETTFFASGLRALVEGAGLRVAAEQVDERTRSFDDWMQIAGWQRGDAAYQRTRALMEAAIPGDLARFHTRAIPGSTDLEFVQTSLLLVADKP